VLQNPSSRLPIDSCSPTAAYSSTCTANCSTRPADFPASAADCEARRPLQLRRRLGKLAGRLVSSEKGVVLQSPWQGMCESGWRFRDIFGTLRLQRRICKLDGRMVGPEESLVLHQQGQRLPCSSWWMCLSVTRSVASFLTVALVLDTIFWCCWQVLFRSNLKCADLQVRLDWVDSARF